MYLGVDAGELVIELVEGLLAHRIVRQPFVDGASDLAHLVAEALYCVCGFV